MRYFFVICISLLCMNGCVGEKKDIKAWNMRARALSDAVKAVKKPGYEIIWRLNEWHYEGWIFQVSNKQILTIEEAREFLVYNTELYLSVINSDQHRESRPYLHAYPLTVANIFLCFTFSDDGECKTTPFSQIGNISVRTGTARYVIVDEKDSILSIHEEPYEEAKAAVKAARALRVVSIQ